MYKQHRPRLSGSTLFAKPIIFIFILCIYIIKMALHIRTEVHAQTGHTQTCTIRHITHSHVITSPQWPFTLGQKLYTLPEWHMHWDRSVCTNSADPDLVRVCTIWHTANIYMLYLRIVESTCSSLSVWQYGKMPKYSEPKCTSRQLIISLFNLISIIKYYRQDRRSTDSHSRTLRDQKKKKNSNKNPATTTRWSSRPEETFSH